MSVISDYTEIRQSHDHCQGGVDEERGLVLLATLNRLRGEDDPFRRSELLARLREGIGAVELVKVLPEHGAQIEKLLALRRAAPLPRVAVDLERRLNDLPRDDLKAHVLL